MQFRIAAAILVGALAIGATDARAMGSGPSESPSASKPNPLQDFTSGKNAIQAGQYEDGITWMKKVVAADPKNADAYNYIGFAYRKLGDVKQSAANYDTALRLNPDHKGALEYQGELFLKLNKMPDAEKNRARLQVLCPAGCTELKELDRAIADFKATGGTNT